MNKITLNGEWKYRLGKGKWDSITVPYSVTPVGHSECERVFDVPCVADRYYLRFDGITYYAKIILNGNIIGEMLPYCEYRFDISSIVKQQGNILTVALEDIEPEFGPSAGWGNYGGIIRDVWLEYSEDTYIKDVFFHTDFEDNYDEARYTVEWTLDGDNVGDIEGTLSYQGKVVDSFCAVAQDKSVIRTLKGVALWSPDEPNLYTLTVSLKRGQKVLDTYTASVGFREFKCGRHHFILNGKDIFLQGVCRHEMVADYGHTVPYEIIERELKKIKSTGCNFVRLVHYPHCRETLEIADKIGLMVSEEPGLWWSDTANPEISAGSISVLKQTILRDRNHPSIVFWLCFNECFFTEQFLLDSVKACRQLDATRLVSGANCMSDEDTYQYYNKCGFDFYTMHPYSDTMERAKKSATVLNDKPLMFTEWGGYFVYDNPHLIRDFITDMYQLYLKNSDEGALAGASYWYWSEVDDYGRGKPACVDGVLKEALTDKAGNTTMIYDAFCNAWRDAKRSVDIRDEYSYTLLDNEPLGREVKCQECANATKVLDSARVVYSKKLETSRPRVVSVGPILNEKETGISSEVPYILCDNETLHFDICATTDTITIIGATSLRKGYPIKGVYGEDVAEIIVKCEDKDYTFTMQNGVHLTTAYTSIASSKINPRAEIATPFAIFSYEKNFENYIINKLKLHLPLKSEVKSLTIKSLSKGYDLLFYSVFTN